MMFIFTRNLNYGGSFNLSPSLFEGLTDVFKANRKSRSWQPILKIYDFINLSQFKFAMKHTLLFPNVNWTCNIVTIHVMEWCKAFLWIPVKSSLDWVDRYNRDIEIELPSFYHKLISWFYAFFNFPLLFHCIVHDFLMKFIILDLNLGFIN